MCAKIASLGVTNLVGYTTPVLHQGKKWYVDFYANDPSKDSLRRKKYFIADDLKVSEKKRRAAEIIEALSRQLRQGWSPWVSTHDSRGFILFEEVCQKYLEGVEKRDRKKTRDNYRSRMNIMQEYINKCSYPIKYAYQFDEAFCNEETSFVIMTEKVLYENPNYDKLKTPAVVRKRGRRLCMLTLFRQNLLAVLNND